MHTILGAGGAISTELAARLYAKNLPYRLVGRNPQPRAGATTLVTADLTDLNQTVQAVAGSKIVYLLVGLKYDVRIWKRDWPRVMMNTIEACKRANAKLIFFDNVYMYGKVDGPMTEETPFNPCTQKGEIRAALATHLIDEWKSGALTAMIARSADFYGPGALNGGPHLLVFDPLSKGKLPSTTAGGSQPHSFTYTRDAAEALLKLSESESEWNQTWHLPTAPNPLTETEFIQLAAKEFGASHKHKNLSRTLFRLGGIFDRTIYECIEMLYQNDSPYIFDSSKYAAAIGFSGTPYEVGIHETATTYPKPAK